MDMWQSMEGDFFSFYCFSSSFVWYLFHIIKLLLNGGLVVNLLLDRNFVYLLSLMTLFVISEWNWNVIDDEI